ncbi:MAG: tenI [Candidatus Krumholzibacteriota bacterium]|nr:tenI [Candidatus Krumholzibacteriota bacterium]
MIDFRLYLVTDRRLVVGRSLEDAVGEAFRAGVRAVQLREKDLDARSLLDLAVRVRAIASAADMALLVNDRADIALACGANGVQLPEAGFPAVAARRVLAEKALVGVSAHSLGAALAAEDNAADFITFGPVFETPSKLQYGAPLGLDALRQVASALRIPVYAIGGITPERAKVCRAHGAHGVAVISAILGAPDIARAVGGFEKALGGL